MKIIKWINRGMLILSVGLVIYSCSKDDTVVIPTSGDVPNYVLSFQSIGANNEPLDLILQVPTLDQLESGELSVEGKGVPQVGWRYVEQSGSTVFSFPYFDDDKAVAYQVGAQGDLVEVNNVRLVDNKYKNIARLEDGKLLVADLAAAALIPESGVPTIPEILFTTIDGKTGKAENTVTNKLDNNLEFQNDPDNPVNLENSYLPWISGTILKDNKLFVSYQKLSVDGAFNLIAANKAYVAVLNYPALTLDSLIEDDRTNSIGVNAQIGMSKTENNTIYAYASSASVPMGIFGNAENPSGILRINSQSTNFDKNYFFDVENAPNGGKLFWMDYIAKDKAIARILVEENTTEAAWSAFGEQGAYFKLVVLDLKNKTVTDVSGMPLHANRYTAKTYVENGKAYISARTGEPGPLGSITAAGETYIYIINPETATAVRGAKVNGVSIKGIFKISK